MDWPNRIVCVLLTVLALLVPFKAGAATVEAPDREVKRIEVRYTEPVPTSRFPNRRYFETNDGAAYRYGTYGQCDRADAVANRVCRTVFWYAR